MCPGVPWVAFGICHLYAYAPLVCALGHRSTTFLYSDKGCLAGLSICHSFPWFPMPKPIPSCPYCFPCRFSSEQHFSLVHSAPLEAQLAVAGAAPPDSHRYIPEAIETSRGPDPLCWTVYLWMAMYHYGCDLVCGPSCPRHQCSQSTGKASSLNRGPPKGWVRVQSGVG